MTKKRILVPQSRTLKFILFFLGKIGELLRAGIVLSFGRAQESFLMGEAALDESWNKTMMPWAFLVIYLLLALYQAFLLPRYWCPRTLVLVMAVTSSILVLIHNMLGGPLGSSSMTHLVCFVVLPISGFAARTAQAYFPITVALSWQTQAISHMFLDTDQTNSRNCMAVVRDPSRTAISRFKLERQTRQSREKPRLFGALSLSHIWWTLSMALIYHILSAKGILPYSYTSAFIWITVTLITAIVERHFHIRSSAEAAAAIIKTSFRKDKDALGPWKVSPSRVPIGKIPLIVFVNRKSGGGRAEQLIAQLEAISRPNFLNELQVWDLARAKPLIGFQPWLDYLATGRKIRVLVAGGDGTVAWVLGKDGIEGLPYESRKHVSVGICPLGTGNDLSRALGWGGRVKFLSQHAGACDDLVDIIVKIAQAEEILLDRWTVHSQIDTNQDIDMYNYCGLYSHLFCILAFSILLTQSPAYKTTHTILTQVSVVGQMLLEISIAIVNPGGGFFRLA